MGNRESGMTLVEVLAALVLVSIVAMLVTAPVITSIKYNAVETQKTRLQQEANLIITRIQKEHRNRDCYILMIDEKEISIKDCSGDMDSKITISSGYIYSPINKKADKLYPKIYPKKDDLDLHGFSIQDLENPNLKVSFDTLITRYKEKVK